MTAPRNGAVRYTHSDVMSAPTSAGASERVGFTDAPLNGIPAKWMTTSVIGMMKPAWEAALFVTVRMTAMNTAVSMTSIPNAWSSVSPGNVRVAATAVWLTSPRIKPDAAMAPTACATT